VLPKLGIGAEIPSVETRDKKKIKHSSLPSNSLRSLALDPAAIATAAAWSVWLPATVFAGMHRKVAFSARCGRRNQ
jgi:hypothetical protein